MPGFLCLLFSLFIAYLSISLFFLFFPQFFIKKNRNSFIQNIFKTKPFQVIGHRGGLKEVPENTFAGVELAIKNQTSFELDVQKTKDGKLVLCHDYYLERLTGQKKNISELNYDEIEPLLDNVYNSYDD